MKKNLVAFDLDETLFVYDDTADVGAARVIVRQGEYLYKRLLKGEYSNYVLEEDEEFDYAEFEDAKVFRDTAIPVKMLVDSLKHLVDNHHNDYDVAIVTARGNFEDMEAFRAALKHYGIDADRVKLVMCGEHHAEFVNSPERKKKGFRDLFGKEPPQSVVFFDDQPNNLKAFLELGDEYPGTTFDARIVYANNDGTAKVEVFV